MAESSLQKDAAKCNPRGIPYAPFVDKVEDFVSSPSEVRSTLGRFQDMISKYRFMEANQEKQTASLKDKLPDIQKTLDMVQFLRTRKSGSEPIEAMFELCDTLYAKAHVLATNEVYLWLGAGIMLAYPIEEAEEMLQSKLSAAKQSLANCQEDIGFLREQITTMEVNIARVYNWDVVARRKESAERGAIEDMDMKGPPNG